MALVIKRMFFSKFIAIFLLSCTCSYAALPHPEENRGDLESFLKVHPIFYPPRLFLGTLPGNSVAKPPGIHAEILLLKKEDGAWKILRRYFGTAGAPTKTNKKRRCTALDSTATNPGLNAEGSSGVNAEGSSNVTVCNEVSEFVVNQVKVAREALQSIYQRTCLGHDDQGAVALKHEDLTLAIADYEAEAKVFSGLFEDFDHSRLQLDGTEVFVLRSSDPMCHQCQIMSWLLSRKLQGEFLISWDKEGGRTYGEDPAATIGSRKGLDLYFPACRGLLHTEQLDLNSIEEIPDLLKLMKPQVKMNLDTFASMVENDSLILKHQKSDLTFLLFRHMQIKLQRDQGGDIGLIKSLNSELEQAEQTKNTASSDEIYQKQIESKLKQIENAKKRLEASGLTWIENRVSQLEKPEYDDSFFAAFHPSFEALNMISPEVKAEIPREIRSKLQKVLRQAIQDIHDESLLYWQKKIRKEINESARSIEDNLSILGTPSRSVQGTPIRSTQGTPIRSVQGTPGRNSLSSPRLQTPEGASSRMIGLSQERGDLNLSQLFLFDDQDEE